MAGKTNFAFQQQNCLTLWNDGAWLNFFQEYSYYWGLRLEPRVSIIFQEYSYTWAGETYKEIATYKPDMTGEHTKWKMWSPGLYGKFLWLAALSFSYWYWKSVGTVATLYKPINIYKPCLISELAKKTFNSFSGMLLATRGPHGHVIKSDMTFTKNFLVNVRLSFCIRCILVCTFSSSLLM